MTACVSPTTVSNLPAHGGEILPSISGDNVSPRPVMKEHHHLFPFKLYDMLEYAADSEHSSVVSWVKEGRRFAIHNKDEFLKHIVPRFFKQTKYRSFVSLFDGSRIVSSSAIDISSSCSRIALPCILQTRQLNLWGFRRFSADGSVWGHRDFIRGHVERLKSIERIEIKSGGKPKTESKSKKRPLSRRVTESDEAVPNESAYVVPPTIDVPENAPPQPLIPNRAFQPQQPAPIASHMHPQVQPPNYSNPVNSQSNDFQPEPHMPENDYTFRGTNEEDILFLLSGLFESEDGSSSSSGGEDLSSIFNDLPEDFMNPIGFF